jgi:serine protease Do
MPRSVFPVAVLPVTGLIAALALNAHAADFAVHTDPASAVYKIRAIRDGHVADGSAVLIAPGRLLTTCHVTRGAESITVGRKDSKWPAYPVTIDIEHDLCVLSAPALSAAKPASIGQTETLRVYAPVTAAGYRRGGKLALSHGRIVGLHPHDGASVLQVSASFDHGQSGGGLFDAMGRLIGIIGFKAVAGGNYQFALPLAWAGEAIPGQAPAMAPTAHGQAFWERTGATMPLFLLAASLEANRDWKALHGVAQEWVVADADNPASWLCLSRVLTRLKRDLAAAHAYGQATTLAPSLSAQPDRPRPPVKMVQATSRSISLDRPARQ